MIISTARQSLTIALESSGDLSGLVAAVESMAVCEAVCSATIAVMQAMLGGISTAGSARIRPLPAGGIEVVVAVPRVLPEAQSPPIQDVMVLTDRWVDDKGSCVLLRVFADPGAVDCPIGTVESAFGGSVFSGDAWAVLADHEALILVVLDGLGHGPLADIAARAGMDAVRGMGALDPADAMRELHHALTGTVGAAAGIARFDARRGVITFCGVGNIDATLVNGQHRAGLVSFPGVVGQRLPALRTFQHDIQDHTCLVMHTDGLRPTWNPAAYPGLSLATRPSLEACYTATRQGDRMTR